MTYVIGGVLLSLLGLWGLRFTWTNRAKTAGSLFFDYVSPIDNPKLYLFTIGLRLISFGLCFLGGLYQVITNLDSLQY